MKLLHLDSSVLALHPNGQNEWTDTSIVADDVQVKFKFVLTSVGKF